MTETKTYVCIDLKSFYASVECVARGLDPFTTNLVVADPSRTEKTICLAITPAMKDLGIRNRCRVFEIPKEVQYIMAPPRMKRYMEVSVQIYRIYLRFVAPEDIHVYSIDECFIDATPYLSLYSVTPKEFAVMLMDAVFKETGICATAGIGTNLFLAKVALDITAKHVEDHIGYLDQEIFRRTIAHHRPITDIWNIGPGIARRLAKYHVFDLAGVCAMDESVLYREFGVNAEYLIDHARGIEPCTIAEIQAYVPEGSSISSGQVLSCDYTFDEGLIILREMVDALCLELVDRGLVASGISLSVGYAREKNSPWRDVGSAGAMYVGAAQAAEATSAGSDGAAGWGAGAASWDGDKSAGAGGGWGAGGAGSDAGWGGNATAGVSASGEHNQAEQSIQEPLFVGEHGVRWSRSRAAGYTGGSRKLGERTNSFAKLMRYFEDFYRETTKPDGKIRRINIGFGSVLPEEYASLGLFDDAESEQKERERQKAVIAIKDKFGKNALLRGTSLKEKATARERNEQVGGHHG